MFNTRQGRDLNLGPCGWKAEILPLRQPRRRLYVTLVSTLTLMHSNCTGTVFENSAKAAD